LPHRLAHRLRSADASSQRHVLTGYSVAAAERR
jgi:hypothetical protein